MITPFIGITGFLNRTELEGCLERVPKDGIRKLMVGVLANEQTIAGEISKSPGKYPINHNIAAIFRNNSRVFNCLHYSKEDQTDLLAKLTQAMDYAGDYCHGLQLNMNWPEPQVLEEIKTRFPGLKIILRILPFMAGMHSVEAANVLRKKYNGLADCALIDFSRDRKSPLDLEQISNYLRFLKHLDWLSLAIDCGLGPDNIKNIGQDLCRCFPGISFNAELLLRDNTPGYGYLDLNKARSYLKNAHDLFIAN